MKAALVILAVVCAPALHAQATERIGRVELADGYVSVDARPDGLVLVSAINTLRFDVASGVFSTRTMTAWLDRVSQVADSVRRTDGASFGSSTDLAGADGETQFRISFELSAAPALSAAIFRRSDGVEIGLRGTGGDSSFTRLLALMRSGVTRTTDLTLASPDSFRLRLSDTQLTGRDRLRPGLLPRAPQRLKLADRLFITGAGAALAGVGMSYATHVAVSCPTQETYCRWQIANPGFAVGSTVGATLAGVGLTRGGPCTLSNRLFRSLIASSSAAVPGAILASDGKQSSIALTPALQAMALNAVLKRCRP